MAGSTEINSGSYSLSSFSISLAHSESDIALISDLFRAYVDWLDIDLTYQDFASELDALPGKYASPDGALLLARDNRTNEVLGCIAMRPLALEKDFSSQNSEYHGAVRHCELKRLYMLPAARGRGIGRALVRKALLVAEQAGYDDVLLDTLPKMTSAIALYRLEGFELVDKYYDTPREETMFMSKRLRQG